jgi:hypothetical protein
VCSPEANFNQRGPPTDAAKKRGAKTPRRVRYFQTGKWARLDGKITLTTLSMNSLVYGGRRTIVEPHWGIARFLR